MNMSPSMVLVHEFFMGGGCGETPIPTDLAGEGRAMLQGVLMDFRSCGRFRTLTTLDERLPEELPWADQCVRINHRRYEKTILHLIARCGAALFIAPENHGILTFLSASAEMAGVTLLGSNANGTAVASDKWRCYEIFKNAGVPTPETWRTHSGKVTDTALTLGFPLVVKPIDGAGAEGVSLISDLSTLKRVMEADMLPGDAFLFQRFLDGEHYSVSLLVSERDIVPLSLNEQFVHMDVPIVYKGGAILPGHGQAYGAMAIARHAVSLIPGLKGYVGVDMVLAGGRWYVIEINPRLTTSYVGLRRASHVNIGEAIWLACTENTLPNKVKLTKRTEFHKENLIGI